MKFISVIENMPSKEQHAKLEILHYLSCIANPVFAEAPKDWEAQLLSKIRQRFGDMLDIEYVDQNLEPASPQDNGLIIRVFETPRVFH